MDPGKLDSSIVVVQAKVVDSLEFKGYEDGEKYVDSRHI